MERSGVDVVECRKLTAEWKQPLLVFLEALRTANDIDYFSPHPFTAGAIENIIQTARLDIYCILVEGSNVLAYGMLRGWDEGYDVPSLGIAVHPLVRNTGWGKAFMYLLNASAKRRGATK